ncbi:MULTISPECIES: hypothetical protein [unclassified Flavobacterium]|uniref:hypothetical protein n=1 Tax=unclassified Flavobacterium TaxID=196869 RepID=UPI003605BA77
MKTIETPELVNAIVQHFTEEWLDEYGYCIELKCFTLFQFNLLSMLIKGQPKNRLPLYTEEIHIDLSETIAQFRKLYAQQHDVDDFSRDYAKLLMEMPFIHWLAIMGQRFTESSATDVSALPPSRETLIKSCAVAYNNEITVARRAWEKHLGRGHTDFWGTMKGNNYKKEKQVRELVAHIIDNASWWNVFYHYKHGWVYEIRIPNGNGIRWNREGTELIGFLEPFIVP